MLNKAKKSEIAEAIGETYYPMNFTLDGIRADYKFDATCQGSVPQAKAFLESTDFEDSIRNAVSIGGDSDTCGNNWKYCRSVLWRSRQT